MTNKRGVLWDLDGVVVDTGEFHYQSWSLVLPEYDLPVTRETFQATFGMNNAGVLAMLYGPTLEPELVAEIGDRKEEAFREALRGHVQALPGVLDWLRRLKADGVPQALATSAPPANIHVMLDELDLWPYFDAVLSGSDLPGKPDPTLFLKAAGEIGVPPERCVVVEDAVAGVEAAKRAGMRCIAVTTTNPADILTEADVIVERLDALPLDSFEVLWDAREL
jgi:HAD superfamily hydrolase (TIGR01509 family)